MGPSKAPWTDEVPLASLHNSKGPHFLNIPYQGSQDQMQISLATFVRDVGGIPQRIIILLPLVCVRTHLPSPLLLEITPLEQVRLTLNVLARWVVMSTNHINIQQVISTSHEAIIDSLRCFSVSFLPPPFSPRPHPSFPSANARSKGADLSLNFTICPPRNPFNYPFNCLPLIGNRSLR